MDRFLAYLAEEGALPNKSPIQYRNALLKFFTIDTIAGMMRKWIAIFLIFFFPVLLKGNAFFEDADPALFHHVNVVTGNLNLTYEDVSIGGVVPYTVPRTYRSSGFSVYFDEVTERKKALTKSPWIFGGGWTLLAHGHLHLQVAAQKDYENQTVPYLYWPSIAEKDGSTLDYFMGEHWLDHKKIEKLPSERRSKKSPHPNPRRDPLNNRLILEETKATLFRSDGSVWHYSGNAVEKGSEGNWHLDLEVLPSKHRVVYQYDEANWLKRIEVQNPAGNKAFGFFDFNHKRFEEERKLKIRTSEGKAFEYAFEKQHKKQFYLDSVTSTSRPCEQVRYQPSRKGKSLRIETLKFDDCAELGVTYYRTSKKKKERKWKSGKDHPPIKIDRVHHLLLPDPETGELIPFAEFKYQPGITKVYKSDGGRIVYHYRNKYLLVDRIEYFDAANNLHSEVLLNWEENIRLKKKTLRDGSGNPILSKRMHYDKRGNLTREILNDYRQNKQSFVRSFSYYKENNLLEKEVSPNGVAIHYTYLLGTDLVHKKETIAPNGELIYREITEYDDDHLPIKVILDDEVKERHIQIFKRDPQTGRVQKLINACTDFGSGVDHWIDKHSFTYNAQGKVETETVTYPDESSYTLHYSYNDQGHLIKQSTPSGRESTYLYDQCGRKIEAKEVGQPKQTFTYDQAGRLRMNRQGEKTTYTYYDQKGCLRKFIDPFGNQIDQEYNSFGKNIKTRYPSNVDSRGEQYNPIIETQYDILGNPKTASNSLGETTKCTHDILGNILTETDPDGYTTRYSYNQAGSLIRINHPDQSITTFSYDPLQRKTTKKIYNPGGELFSEEYWSYDSFHLLAYTNPMGLITEYLYDCFGRKIEENSEGRVITYTYDARGNLQAVTKNGATSHMVYNEEGEILEQWEEDRNGKIENWMSFTYDEEGRKVAATRQTSEGKAHDTFEYDEEGRLICHRDPLGACSEIQYQTVTNSLGQTVQQKKTIDPLGNQTIEREDANGHLVLIEKMDSNEVTVAKEQRMYDRAGNLERRINSIYDQNHPIRTYQTQWKYNKRGLPIQEIEEGKKTTLFEYDSRGNIIQKTDPRGVILKQKFDALGRLIEQQSSDGTVHNSYLYQDKGKILIAKDHIYGRTWKRVYNRFGELISEETPHGAIQTWSYDNAGKCTLHTLPDRSSIAYAYSALHMDQVTRQSKENKILYRHTYNRFDENGHVAEEECIHNLGTFYTQHDLLERPKSTTTPWHRASIDYGLSGLVTRRENSFFHAKDYEYDPLNQLTKEGVKEHHFDSLGNPLDQAINSLNQITQVGDITLLYDASGNLKEKLKSTQVTKYRYDALNRLVLIENESKITFEYDPFSRLYAKIKSAPNQPAEEYFYLFDQDQEIGIYNEDLELLQLKVVGLGLREDVGGAIAIEADNKIYVPLHDFSGNIIALISSKGNLVETRDIDAFGEILLTQPSLSPWGFSSKRTEEGLVYFVGRFYDPALGRWLTPDPAGAIDSPNLYLYVHNNPLSRLDLFGLTAQPIRIEIKQEVWRRKDLDFVPAVATFGEHSIDCFVRASQIEKIQFSPEEIKGETLSIIDHIPEIIGSNGNIQIILYFNGINNTEEDHKAGLKSISDNLEKVAPGNGCVMIGMFKETKGIVGDLFDVVKQKVGIKTPEVILGREILITFAEILERTHPLNTLTSVAHSGGGAWLQGAFKCMNTDQKERMRNRILSVNAAPASCISKEATLRATNSYSNRDLVTGIFGVTSKVAATSRIAVVGIMGGEATHTFSHPTYNVKFLESNKLVSHGVDHSILCDTQQGAINEEFRQLEKKYGFYKKAR